MAKFAVLLADARTIMVFAPDEEGAKKQAIHHETTRIMIAAKRDRTDIMPASFPFSITKIKD